VQAERLGRWAVLMVRRRSTVRFRKGAPSAGASQRRPAHECARITDYDAGRSALPRLLAWILFVHHEHPAATPHHDRARTRLQPSQRIPDLHNALLCFLSALVTTSLARSFPSGRAGPGYLRTCCCCRTLPQLWALHVVPFGRAERPCSGLTRVSTARGRRPAARCCWPVSSARPSRSGSTCRGDI
jgi:hypothetical protein